MKKLSIARKYKLITGTDIFKTLNDLKKESESETFEMTEHMEFVEYGLFLAIHEPDLVFAKKEFRAFNETGEFDIGKETLKSLIEQFKASFGEM